MEYEDVVLAKAKDLQNMMKTRGWSEIVYPMLKDMIFTITGGEENGRFIEGLLNKTTDERSLYQLIGKKNGLVEFWNNLVGVIFEADQIKKRLDNNKKED